MGDNHRIRLVLANQDWQAISYQLGVVELIRTSEESQLTGHLGPDLGAPVNLARRLLDANKERFGHITTGNQHRGRPCRRCGTPIRSEGAQDRITYWCPSCQPG